LAGRTFASGLRSDTLTVVSTHLSVNHPALFSHLWSAVSSCRPPRLLVLLLAGTVPFLLLTGVNASQPLQFQEAPVASGYFSAYSNGSFAGVGTATDWQFDAEAGDRLSVRIETETGNSRPRIRLLNPSGSAIVSVDGGTDGVAFFQNREITVPGTYRVRVYTDHEVSPYRLRVDLTRGKSQEQEPNNSVATANAVRAEAGSGSFSVQVAGYLDRERPVRDLFALGNLNGAATVTAGVVTGAPGQLQNGEVELRLVKGDGSMVAVAGGETGLTAAGGEAGRYFVQVGLGNRAGSALSFDGVNDIAVIPHAPELSLTAFSVEAWVYPRQQKSDWQPLIVKTNDTSADRNFGLYIRPNSMTLLFSFQRTDNQYNSWDSQAPLVINEWNHVAMTYDGTTFRLFLNGRLDRAQATSGTIRLNGHPIKLGRERSTYTGFDGMMDELRIWNRARSGAEIASSFDRVSAGADTQGLVGHWRFDEGAGGTFADSGPHGFTGTLGDGGQEDEPEWEASYAPLDSRAGLDARYWLTVSVADAVSPTVADLTLPPEHGRTTEILHAFQVTFSEELNPITANNPAHYELRHAGPDGVFGTPDDDLYPVQPQAYAGGLAVDFTVGQGPLQPGLLRFTVTPGVTDLAGNPVSPAFVRLFEVEELGIFSFESRGNNSLATATPLVFRPSVDDPSGSGFRTAAGRGRLLTGENRDYWRFEANAGDRLLLASENNPSAGGTGLRFDVLRPDGSSLGSLTSWDGTDQISLVLPVDGTYRIEVRYHYTYTGEYRFRATIAPATWQMETESNNTIGSANTVQVHQDGGVYRGRTFGYVRPGGDVDLFSPLPIPPSGDAALFPLPAGTLIHVGVRMPSTSPLIPILEILNSSGTVRQSEENEPSISYTVPADEAGRHYLRVRASGATGGLLSVYLLDFAVTLPQDTVPPTVVSVTLPPAGSVSPAAIDRFQITFSEDLMAVTANDLSNYELRHAGADGVFGTADDDLYPVALTAAYTSGTTLTFLIGDSPLQPGAIRLTVGPGIADRAGNLLQAPFIHEFAVESVPGFVLEQRVNNSVATATPVGAVLAGSFDRSFGESVSLSTASQPYWVSQGDVNADGHSDLVVANYTAHSVSVYLGRGDGTFQNRVDYPTGNNPREVILRDFNGNGLPDIVTVNTGGNNVTVLLNQGGGSFAPGVHYPAGSSPRAIAAGHLNGDSHLDLAVASHNDDTVIVLLGNGQGGFIAGTPLVKAGSRPHGIAAADFTGNGTIDLAVANNLLHSVTVYPGNGDGTFGAGVDYPSPDNPVHLAAGDLDGDGRPDLVVVPNSGVSVGLLWAQPGGSFSAPVLLSAGSSATNYSVRLEDVDGDGLDDVLVSRGTTVSLRYNLGSRQFEPPAVYGMGSTVRSALAGDFNSDGRPDLVAVASGSNTLQIRLGLPENRLALDAPTGFRQGAGRGTIAAGGAANYDYWRFSGRAGERVLLAYQNHPSPTAAGTGLRFGILRPDGGEIASFNPYAGQDHLGAVLPVSGTYTIEVRHHYSYTGEYRFRLTVAPAPWLWESETNDTVGNANALAILREEPLQLFRALGYLRLGDAGDILALRNHPANSQVPLNDLPEGTTIVLNLIRPASSTLLPRLDVLNSAGAAVASADPGIEALAYTVPAGGEGRYYARVREGGSNHGFFADYGLTVAVHVPTDDEPPVILTVSLPPEGTVTTSLVDRFGITFSEDLDVASANDVNTYELRHAGADGIFGTGDDELYPLSLTSAYTVGLSINFFIPDAPLQPGKYRFTVSTDLKDIARNSLAAPYVREFSVANVDGFLLESRGSNSAETATVLSTLPPGAFDGSFASGPVIPAGADPYAVRAVDLNQDGILDLVVAQYTANTVGVRMGRADGNFEARTDYPVGNRPRDLVVGDFNGNGWLDVAAANETGNTVSILLNQQNGTLALAGSVAAGSSPRAIAAGDFNGDGNLDLAVASYTSNAVILLLGNGDGTFTAGASLPKAASRPHGIAVADFNGDGKLDLAVANYDPNSVTVYLGLGDGTFGPGSDYPVLANPVGLRAADLTGDGVPDLVAIPNSNASVSLLRGMGDGTFGDAESLSFGASATNRGLLLADLDGDGRPEILVARGNAAAVRFNLGGGVFEPATNFAAGSTARDLAVGDFNGDGVPDLAVAVSGNNAIQILHGRRAQLLSEDPAGSGFRSVAGRGMISAGGAANYDYWSFSARAGDRLLLAYQNHPNPAAAGTGLRFGIIRPDGAELTSFSPYNGQEQLAVILPVSGTYWIEVRHYYSYLGEYRFRAILAPPPWQLESESNDTPAQANVAQLRLEGGAQRANLLGYFRLNDGADVYALGNLSGGTEIRLGSTQPAISTFQGLVEVLDAGGTVRFSNSVGLPFIVRQPFSRHVEAGAALTLSVEAGGAVPISYQWYRNDVPLPGATSATLVLQNVQHAQGGQYHVVVSNAAGAVRSRDASVVVLTTLVDAYRNAVLGLGARGYWRLNEASGGTAADSALADGAQHGLYGGTVGFGVSGVLAGDPDMAISLNGTDAHVRVPDSSSPTSYTIAGWVKPSAYGRTIFARTSGTGFHSSWSHVLAVESNGRFSHYLFDGSGRTVIGNSTAVLGEWHFVAATAQQNGTMRLYVNGVEEGSAQAIGTPWQGGDTYGIGHSTPRGGFFHGAIDEVTLFPRALSAEEIMDLYSIGAGTALDGGNVSLASLSGTSPSDLPLTYTVPMESAGGYFVRVRPNAGVQGIFAEYRLHIALLDALPPTVVSTNLPGEAVAVTGLIDRFRLTFSEDMAAATVNDVANYELRGAGVDGLFDTEDDVFWPLSLSPAFSSGSVADFLLPGLLQPDDYRFLAGTGLTDRAGNNLESPFIRSFRVSQLPGFVTEREPNNTRAAATPLAMDSSQPGLISGAARGYVASSDVDYYSFEAEAGDVVVIAMRNPGDPSNSRLNFRIERANGSLLFNYDPASNGSGQSAPFIIPATETYYLRIWHSNTYTGEYRARVSLYRGIEAETEANGSLATANPLTLTPFEAGFSGAIGGHVAQGNDLDYFALGTIQAGQTVFLSIRQPNTSPLVPVVSLYNAANQYLAEAGSGRAFDGVAEVNITQTDQYFALVRGSGDSGGLMSEYILDVLVLPTGNVSFPNLQVVNLSLQGAAGLRSGDSFGVTFRVENVGSQATQVNGWFDRVVLSANNVFGDGDDIELALHQRVGALSPGAGYTITQQVQVPHGISGSYFVAVKTDATNVVNEFVMEGDNVTFSESPLPILLAPYPDLVIEDLQLTGPDGAGTYSLAWNTWNRGDAQAPSGFKERVRVRNLGTNVVVHEQIFTVGQAIAPGAFRAGAASFAVITPGVYRVEVKTDAEDEIYEFNEHGHALAEQNTVSTQFSITRFFTVSLTASPEVAGNVSGGGSYAEGSTVTVVATPITTEAPYQFVNWLDGGAFRSANATYTFTATRDRQLTAVFTLPTYFIATSVSPHGGTISGGGPYLHGSQVQLTANPQPGYLFSHWTDGAVSLGSQGTLTFVALGNRTIVAHFVEANPLHEVTTATAPEGLAVVSGAGSFSNGQASTISAPSTIEQGDTEYVFEKFTLNGTYFGTQSTFSKLFSTLDPAAMHFVAHYRARSLLPAVVSASGSKSGVVPAALPYAISLRFDRAMNPAFSPVAILESTAATPAPVFTGGGVWSRGQVENDTFTTAPVSFEAGHDGVFSLRLSGARDVVGREMEEGVVFSFTVDATPPAHPGISISATTASSVTVSWSGYVAPADLNAFRIYREAAPFVSTEGLSLLTGTGKAARSFTFDHLLPDTDYHVAVAAVDVAGNCSPGLSSTLIRLESEIPPPVSPTLALVSLDKIRLNWSTYSRTNLVGFQGFRIFVEPAPFSSVAGLTPIADLDKATSHHELAGLDRTREYYFAVVGYNRLGQLNPAVTSLRWADPLSGAISADLTVGGAGESVLDIHGAMTFLNGARLTVRPGTTLRFAPGRGITVQQGALIAEGTPIAPIHFTSQREVTGDAAPGDWPGIRLEAGSGASVLRHVWVRYGGGIGVSGAAPALGHLRLAWNSPRGLALAGVGNLTIGESFILLNQEGIAVEGASTIRLLDSVIRSNGINATAAGPAGLDARGNWWGTADPLEIAAGVAGTVNIGSPLNGEPVLAPAAAAQGGIVRTGNRSLPVVLFSPNAAAYRISEDSTFAGAFFQDVPVQPNSDLYNAYPFAATWMLSPEGGHKTVFVQFQSVSGQLSSPASFNIEYVTAGPVIQSFNLVEGMIMSRPVVVNAGVTAELGVAEIRLLTGSNLILSSSTSPLAGIWDIRHLSAGTYRLRLEARDASGNLAAREANVVVSPAPPPAPVIQFPVNNALLATSTTTVGGTAEAEISVRLTRNNIVVGTVTAGSDGSFSFPGVPLVEGSNELVATAFDSLGAAASAPVRINAETIPPAAVVLETPAYNPRDGLILRWRFAETGKRPTSFRVLWHTAPFSAPAQATGQSAVGSGLERALKGIADGTYFIAVVGYDAAGNASPLSNLQTFALDATPPAFTVSYNRSSPVGPGPLGITVTTNEPLVHAPTLTIHPAGMASPVTVTLSQVSQLVYQGNFPVSSLSASTGNAQVRVAGADMAGNSFSGSPQGPALHFDLTRPTGILTVNRPVPVQVLEDVPVEISLVLTKPAAPDTVPTVSFTPPAGPMVIVPMTGSGASWNGQLTLKPAMNSGFGTFLLQTQDALGNNGSVLTAGERLELYVTELPDPPPVPSGLAAQTLPGGEIRLAWNASSGAETYSVYREAGAAGVPVTLLVAAIGATTFTDLPASDGHYRYAVSASRLGAESERSAAVTGLADREPPGKPENLEVELVATGVRISWKGPSAGEQPASYRVYRNGQAIRSSVAATPFLDSPPRGLMVYTVGGLDSAGNENLSGPVAVEMYVGSVLNLAATVHHNQAPLVTWASGDATGTGYSVYRNGIKQNQAPLTVRHFSDSLSVGSEPVIYAIRAVNAQGQESAPRSVTVYPVELSLRVNPAAEGGDRPMMARYFDRYGVSAGNLAAAQGWPLKEVSLERSSGAGVAVTRTSVLNSFVPSGEGLPVDFVFPGISQAFVDYFFSAVATQETGENGGRVTYLREFVVSQSQEPNAMVTLSPSDLPLAGGLSDFQVRIHNRGHAAMDVVLVKKSGAEAGDLSISVLDAAGGELSRTEFQTMISGLSFTPDGRGYVRIPAGESRMVLVPGVLVPEALSQAGQAVFRAQVSAIYHQVGTSQQQMSGPIWGSTSSTLTETAYYGTLTTDKTGYANDEPVQISGHAIDRQTGEVRANVPLKIGFLARGVRWFDEVVTDGSGAFTSVFAPPYGFAGGVSLWAAHPDVFDNLHQADITVYRLFSNPARASIRMSKNDTLDFSIVLINPADVPLSEFTLGFRAYVVDGETEVPVTGLTGGFNRPMRSQVPGSARETVHLQLQAGLQVPDFVMVEFIFTSAEGASAKFAGEVSLLPAIPILTVVTPRTGYVDVTMDKGALRSQTVTLVNRGLRPLESVEIIPPAEIPWMVVNLPVSNDGAIRVPDIGVGESVDVTVVFAPPEQTPQGFYNDFLLVRGANAVADFKVNLYAQVTTDQAGDLEFAVINILQLQVPNASVRLRHPASRSEMGPFLTDSEGGLLVEGLVEGTWFWQVTAPGHSGSSGLANVTANQVEYVDVTLNRSLVTVTFSVVPVPYTDRYEIKIEQTFETRVPAPVPVFTPPKYEFPSVQPGFEASVVYELTNHGLMSLKDVRIDSVKQGVLTLHPLIEYLPELKPQQTIAIPAVIRVADGGWGGGGGNSSEDDFMVALGGGGGGGGGSACGGDGPDFGDFLAGIMVFAKMDAAGEYGSASGELRTALAVALAAAGAYQAITGLPDKDLKKEAIKQVVSAAAGVIGKLIGCANLNLGSAAGGGTGTGTAKPETASVTQFNRRGVLCFGSGTRVTMADGSERPIEEIRAGDRVRSGRTPAFSSVVREAVRLRADNVFSLEIRELDDPAQVRRIDVTGDHPLWVDGAGWVPVLSIEPGAWLQGVRGELLEVVSKAALEGNRTVHTLQLQGDSAFFAGGILAQELCGGLSVEEFLAEVEAHRDVEE
jgi:hypothetical protein